METTVYGKGTIKFWWKVSSEANADGVSFYIDGQFKTSRNGTGATADWQEASYTISSLGSHTLRCGETRDRPYLRCLVIQNKEALDIGWTTVTGGDSSWYRWTSSAYYGGDCTHSGSVGENRKSQMEMTTTQSGTVSFYWKVSSEANSDYLEFYIDGVRQDRISGSTSWAQKSYTLTSGTHHLMWQYIRDGNGSSGGSNCGWVDYVQGPGTAPPEPDLLGPAVDSALSYTTGGSAAWIKDTSEYYHGDSSAVSGSPSDGTDSWMQTTVTGAGTVTFYWKVDSEPNDHLAFYVDGSKKDEISGTGGGWAQKSVSITGTGAHTLKWRYYKDYDYQDGGDCGWVDYVQWNQTGTQVPALAQATDSSLTFTTGGGANWSSQTTTYYHGGDAAQSGAISNNGQSWMQTTVTGAGIIRFYWKVSSQLGDYLEFFIDGVRQARISGTTDWQGQSYTITGSGSHTLKWRYTKNGSGTGGSDCAWVDYVQWPAECETITWGGAVSSLSIVHRSKLRCFGHPPAGASRGGCAEDPHFGVHIRPARMPLSPGCCRDSRARGRVC